MSKALAVRKPSCLTCRWWDWRDPEASSPLSDDTGLCRLKPPVIDLSDGSIMGEWPMTRGDDWCGEYEEARS